MSYSANRHIPRARLIDAYQARHSDPSVRQPRDMSYLVPLIIIIIWASVQIAKLLGARF